MRPLRIAAFVVAAGFAAQPNSAVRAQPSPVAAVPQVAGLWMSSFAGGLNNLSLQQHNANVMGIYTSNASMPGALAGRFTGNVLRGRWTDAGSSGQFLLVFSLDGRSFTGTWGRSLNSATDGGPWTGRRQ